MLQKRVSAILIVVFSSICLSSQSISDTKYLLYDVSPHEGFNLRRDVYLRVAQLAAHVNRTLVLPPWGPLPHWKGPSGLAWENFFDLEHLTSQVEVIEFHSFLDRFAGDVLIEKVYVLSHAPINRKDGIYPIQCGKNTGYKLHDTLYDGYFFGSERVRAKNITCVEISGTSNTLTPLFEEDDLVMLDNAEVVLHDAFGEKSYWDLRRSMVFAKKLRDEAEKFIDNHFGKKKFIGVHLRRSDFPIVRPNDVPSISGAAKQIKKLMKERQIDKVFLATDGDRKEIEQFLRLVPEAIVYHKERLRFENSENLIENTSHDLCDNPHTASDVAIPGRPNRKCSGNRGDLDKPCRPIDGVCGSIKDEQFNMKALPMEEKILPEGGSCTNDDQGKTISIDREFQESCADPVSDLGQASIVEESCSRPSHEGIGEQEKVLKTSNEKCQNEDQDKNLKAPRSGHYEPKCVDSRSLDQPCTDEKSCPSVPDSPAEPQLAGKCDSKAVQKGQKPKTEKCRASDGTDLDMACDEDRCIPGQQPIEFIEGESLPSEPSTLTEGQIAIVDQIICSRADLFIGSFESTFSFRIQEEREILGKAPDTTFNRLCPDGEKDCRQPTRWTIVK